MAARYKVFVDDNFHYRDEDERRLAGEYDTMERALSVARAIVDESLRHLHERGMSAADLTEQYVFFGEDPFIVPSDGERPFSAREYARSRIAEMCRE